MSNRESMTMAILKGHKVIPVNETEASLEALKSIYHRADRHVGLTEVFSDGTTQEVTKTKTDQSNPDEIKPSWEFHATKPDSFIVSTVFLGINHRFTPGPPLWFETMIFPELNNEEYQERYETWEEAEAGHLKAIAFVLNLFKFKESNKSA